MLLAFVGMIFSKLLISKLFIHAYSFVSELHYLDEIKLIIIFRSHSLQRNLQRRLPNSFRIEQSLAWYQLIMTCGLWLIITLDRISRAGWLMSVPISISGRGNSSSIRTEWSSVSSHDDTCRSRHVRHLVWIYILLDYHYQNIFQRLAVFLLDVIWLFFCVHSCQAICCKVRHHRAALEVEKCYIIRNKTKVTKSVISRTGSINIWNHDYTVLLIWVVRPTELGIWNQ